MDEDQKKKLTIMRAGVIIVMVLVLGLWFFNLRGSLRESKEKMANSSDNVQWQEMKAQLAQTLEETKASLNEMKKEAEDNAAKEAANNLLDGLAEETGKMASSSNNSAGAAATTTATGTSAIIGTSSAPVISIGAGVDCPAYINCMPTIGAARPCQIPAGCEGITQIAY